MSVFTSVYRRVCTTIFTSRFASVFINVFMSVFMLFCSKHSQYSFAYWQSINIHFKELKIEVKIICIHFFLKIYSCIHIGTKNV